MTDDPKPRRPFGERDSDERQLPFGARPGSRRPADAHPPRSRPEPPSEPPADNPSLIDLDSTPTPAVEGEQPPPFDLGAWTVSLDEPAEALDDEPAVQDEPDDAPPIIAARSRRGSVKPEASRLKKTPVPQEPEFESYPQAEAAAAVEKAAQQVAEQRRQIVIRFGVVLRSMGAMLGAAAVIATLFTWWTPTAFLPSESVDQLSLALATQSSQEILVTFVPTLTPLGSDNAGAGGRLNNIGIVSGHRGIHPVSGLPDSGAVCADGLTEQAVVEEVSVQVAGLLTDYGYRVDILDEFDARLQDYRALAMVSIHADSCEYINELATGFKVASFIASQTPDADRRLVGCLINRYGDTTNMPFHANTVTRDMTEYHSFAEIAPETPGAIVEIGFMYLDRELLTTHADVVALGVARGILCYLRDEPIGGETATPVTTPTEPPALPTETRIP